VLGGLPGGVARWIPVVAVSLLAAPLAYVAVRLLERGRRDRPAPPETVRRQALAEVGMVAGTIPWLWMILTPLPAPREVKPIPLVDLVDLLTGSPAVAFFQVVGNLLVFAAFGYFAPMRWRLGPWTVVAMAAAASAIVELLQYALNLGRVSSVDDVLLNAAGSGLAALASRRVWAAARQESRERGASAGEPRSSEARPVP